MDIIQGDPRASVQEVAGDIISFPLFKPEFCRDLIEKVEACGKWMNESTLDTYGPLHYLEGPGVGKLNRVVPPEPYEIESRYEPKQTHPLLFIPGMEELFKQVAEEYVAPIIAGQWPAFDLKIFDHPYVLKYEAGLSQGMGLHEDEEPLAMIVYLNDEYEGGGTRFPLQNYFTGKLPVGHAILYPGDSTHLHAGLPITSGVRYLFLMAFF